MLCEDVLSRKEVIKELGEFNENDKPLKKGARIGQNFSSTKRIKMLPQVDDPQENVEKQDEHGKKMNTVFTIDDINS